MSNFINDTLAEQIERGEVWFGSGLSITALDTSDSFDIRVDVTVDTSFSYTLLTEQPVSVSLGLTPNTSGGSTVVPQNMNIGFGGSHGVTVKQEPTVTDTGSQLFSVLLLDGRFPRVGLIKLRNAYYLKWWQFLSIQGSESWP